MRSRRFWIQSFVAGIAAIFPLRKTLSQQGNSLNSAERLTDQNVVSLEDQLKNGLRVVTPGQHVFVKVVVDLVERGRLPRAMVNLIYEWAIERNPRVPFPYFQYAMRILAKKRGVNLP